ncbi:MAG: hypothetical protein Fur0040_10560 [Sideroxydans sp.]
MSAGIRRTWLALGWLWLSGVWVLSLMPQPPQPLTFEFSDKLEHAAAYAFLMVWFAVVYRGCARLRAALALLGMGLAVEIAQGMSGYRFFEWADVTADAVGILLAAWAMRRVGDGWLARMGWT